MILRIVLLVVFSLAFSIEGLAQNAPLIGIDSNYALDMATRNKIWKVRSEPVDPCELFAKNGCQNARIRLWVGEDGTNRPTYATQTARRAKQAGLKPYLVIFLSDDWADFAKQPAPAVWKSFTLICETGYPATANFGGQFAEWNLPAEGYPVSDDGQARWIADLAAVIRLDPNFAGVFYWSPDWCDGGLWDAFALFDARGVARPGVRAFKP